MEEKRTGLKAALRELASEEAAEIGPHIGLKRLIAYRQRTLPAAEREAVQDHLSLCRHCTGRLLELRDFEAASARGDAAGPQELQEEAWESLARHLPWKASAVRPITGAGQRETKQLRIPRLAYGLAAALLLAVAGLAVWAAVMVQQERQRLALVEQRLDDREEALSAAQRSLAEAERQLAAARGHIQDLEKRPEPPDRVHQLEARVAELTSALEALRRTRPGPEGHDRLAAASPIEISVAPRFILRGQEPESGVLLGGGTVNPVLATQGRFSVALLLADQPTYSEYRLQLMDRAGDVLWTGRRPGTSLLGDAGTSVTVNGLGPGLYRLRIEGLQADRGEMLAEYLLQVGA